MMKCAARIKPGFLPHFIISISQAWGQRVLCCPKRGTFVPPFFVYGKAGRWCPVGTVQRRSTLPLRSVLGVCHWQTAPEAAAENYGPCNPLRAVEFRSTSRKFFEKNLTKNFYSPTARTCAGCQHRRGRSRRPIARSVPSGHGPVISSCWPASSAALWTGSPCACGCS